MACADVQSANIVGYNTTALNAAYYAGGATFITIGAEGANLSEFKPSGLPNISNGQVIIQTLDNYGVSTGTYKYYQGSKVPKYANNGWYNSSDVLITKENDVTFAPGDGLWIKGTATASLIVSGEVSLASVTKNLNAAYALLCNPFPMGISIRKITPAGIAAISNGQIIIQTLDNYGVSTGTYKYYQGSKVPKYATNGWYNSNDVLITDANDVVFNPGQGLWVKGTATATLTFSAE